MKATDTIAAIATPPGEGGIAVVRMSGSASFAIADQVFRGPGKKPSKCGRRALLHGQIYDGNQPVDDALMLVMKNPQTYTREDVIEIQCHGSPHISRQILKVVLEAGARMAGPGEFTERAFLNGRLDLVQAEAVMDLIHARSERAARAAFEQLEGALSRKLNKLYDAQMQLAADMESCLDFAEEELPPLSNETLLQKLEDIASLIAELMATHDEGRLLRQGALAVIAGRANAGKSTLMNALLESDRAIVSHLPGTTRDTIEEALILDGIPIRIVDTAGLRATDCEIEMEGIRRTRSRISAADIILYVVDCTVHPDAAEIEEIDALPPEKTILIINKTDTGDPEHWMRRLSPDRGMLRAAMINGQGLAAIKQRMRERIEQEAHAVSEPHPAVSERHYEYLRNVAREIEASQEQLQSGHDGDCYRAGIHLRNAAELTGELIGRTYHDDLLERVFSKFCVGK